MVQLLIPHMYWLQSKLIRLIGKQLVAKAKLNTDSLPSKLQKYPDTEQWLKIVDINQASIDVSAQ